MKEILKITEHNLSSMDENTPLLLLNGSELAKGDRGTERLNQYYENNIAQKRVSGQYFECTGT